MTERDDLTAPSRMRRRAIAANPAGTSFCTVALYVLTAIAPLVAIALVSATGTAFAVAFYLLAMVVLIVATLAAAPRTTASRPRSSDEPHVRHTATEHRRLR
jgi:VIT1/CCC1 family predicted Fe2+/Mn2+ transporter